MRVLLWHPAALHANTSHVTRTVCAMPNAAKCVINKITTITTTTTMGNYNHNKQHGTTQSWWRFCWTRSTRRIRNKPNTVDMAYTQHWRWPLTKHTHLPPFGHGNENGNVIEKLHKLQLHLPTLPYTHTNKHNNILIRDT